MAEFFDPEVEWVPAAESKLALDRYLGYEGVRRIFTDYLSMWEEILWEPREFIDAGDRWPWSTAW